MPAPSASPQSVADSSRSLPEVTRRLVSHYGGTVDVAAGPGPDDVIVRRDHLLPALDFLGSQESPRITRLIDVVGVDLAETRVPELAGERFTVVYWFEVEGHADLRVWTPAPADDPVLPTITELWPVAEWAEREIDDLFGVGFAGHPDPRPLVVPDGCRGFPLRRDDPGLAPLSPTASPRAAARRWDVRVPAGPAGIDARLGLLLELDGDRVVDARVEAGARWSGFEKRAETLCPDDLIAAAHALEERASIGAGFATALALEELLEVDVPPRAARLRLIYVELERAQHHLETVSAAAECVGAGAISRRAHLLARETAAVIALAARPGARAPQLRVGGLEADVEDEFESALGRLLRTVPARRNKLEAAVCASRPLAIRLGETGRTSEANATAALHGPTARAAGGEADARRRRPYGGYDEYPFEVPVAEPADVRARLLVRLAECRESLRIAAHARDRLERGAVRGDPPPYSRKRIMVHRTFELPDGELALFALTTGDASPLRFHLRGASYHHAAALPRILAGVHVDDVPAIVASLGLLAGIIDR